MSTVASLSSVRRVTNLFAVLSIACVTLAGAQAPAAKGPRDGSELFGPIPKPLPADPKTLPRTSDGKPDFTGVWLAGTGGGGGYGGGPPPPLTPPYAAKMKEFADAAKAGHPFADSVSRCEGFGMPRVMSVGYIEFISKPKDQLTIITEILHEVRRVYLDGRPHPSDLDLTFDGHSIGHWEGDTLVIDTVRIRANGMSMMASHSDKLHVVERITMPNRDGMIDEMTLEDPEALTHPIKEEHYYKRQPRLQEIEEYICTNQRNAPDEKGFQTAE